MKFFHEREPTEVYRHCWLCHYHRKFSTILFTGTFCCAWQILLNYDNNLYHKEDPKFPVQVFLSSYFAHSLHVWEVTLYYCCCSLWNCFSCRILVHVSQLIFGYFVLAVTTIILFLYTGYTAVSRERRVEAADNWERSIHTEVTKWERGVEAAGSYT